MCRPDGTWLLICSMPCYITRSLSRSSWLILTTTYVHWSCREKNGRPHKICVMSWRCPSLLCHCISFFSPRHLITASIERCNPLLLAFRNTWSCNCNPGYGCYWQGFHNSSSQQHRIFCTNSSKSPCCQANIKLVLSTHQWLRCLLYHNGFVYLLPQPCFFH